MDANNKKDEKTVLLPPYMPFKTFVSFIQKLKEYEVIPQRIDPGTLKGYSGGGQKMLIVTLKSLALIDKDRMVSETLRELAKGYKTDNWKLLLKKVITDRYTTIIGSLNIADATKHQLEEKFRAVGADREVLTKCMAFYILALKETGTPVSPHITLVERRGRPREQSRKKTQKIDPMKVPNGFGTGDVIVAGTVQFNIPILPGKPPVKIVVPENISKEEWQTVTNTMVGYISLIEGKKEQK